MMENKMRQWRSLVTKRALSLSTEAQVMVGIDEAGRGPALGPMVYSAVYYSIDREEEMNGLGFQDSKTLVHDARSTLFQKIHDSQSIGYTARIVSALEISHQMQRQIRNLNEIARDATLQVLHSILDQNYTITDVYVDTLGEPKAYQRYLEQHFHIPIRFRVEKKADSLFPIVSAASIVAKVIRDSIVSGWEWENSGLELKTDFGSGYPSDPRTKQWLARNMEPVFAYPSIVRFSWSTIKSLTESAAQIDWPQSETCTKKSSQSILNFFSPLKKRARKDVSKRAAIFLRYKIEFVKSIKEKS